MKSIPKSHKSLTAQKIKSYSDFFFKLQICICTQTVSSTLGGLLSVVIRAPKMKNNWP